MCIQITTDDIITTERCKQSSSNSKTTVRARHSIQASSLKSWLAKQKAKQEETAKCNVNTVGSNPEEICRLHKNNSPTYLMYKYEVAAAGESIFK